LPADRATGVIGLAFDVDGTVVRLAIPRSSAEMLVASLSESLSSAGQAVQLVPKLPGLD
jgi:hypothetical protein